MRYFCKNLPLLACLCLGLSALGAKRENKPKEPKKEETKKKDASRKNSAEGEAPSGKMSLPIPVGHDAKGLKIPYSEAGKLQMIFTIGVANRLDENHLKMTDLRVETFNDDGEREMLIDLPRSVLDLNTHVISTKERATIKRSDFEITGESMQFNTETKQGKLAGNVRMLIYNLAEESAAKPEGETP
jgi:hypothetical protein